MLHEREMERLLKAVANRKRVLIVRLLHGCQRATVGEIAKQIKLSLKATSQHLSRLSSAGYVMGKQQGLYVWYSLTPQSTTIERIIKLIQ